MSYKSKFKPIKKKIVQDELAKLIESVFDFIKEKYGDACSKIIVEGVTHSPEKAFVHSMGKNTYYIVSVEEEPGDLIGLIIMDNYDNILDSHSDRAEIIAICKSILVEQS